MTSVNFGADTSSSSSSEEGLQLLNDFSGRSTQMWKCKWQLLIDATTGAEYWWNEETKERSYLPSELQNVTGVLECDLESQVGKYPSWLSATESKEKDSLTLEKPKEVSNTQGEAFIEVADLILSDFNKKVHQSDDSVRNADLENLIEPEAVILYQDRDEKLSLDDDLPRPGNAKRGESIKMSRALEFKKGVHIQIFFSQSWVPGVIIDVSLSKFVEVMFIFDGENFRKKLKWASAQKQLRAVDKLVHGTWSLSKEEVLARIDKFRADNSVCADCTGAAEWAELIHGVIICSKCSGVHRKLGVHISKVRSLTLDMWTEQMYRKLRGNIVVNEELEYCVPSEYPKPHCDSHSDLREAFIRAKYEKKLFTKKPNNKPVPAVYDVPEMRQRHLSKGRAINSPTTTDINAKPQKSALAAKAQVQYDGFLTIQCFQARDLPALAHIPRGKPNPYCVFLNGSYQKGRTRVCEKTKYPQFNSVVHINVQEKEPLIVLVYDSCRIGKDILLCSSKLDIRAQLEADTEKSFQLPLELTARFKAKYAKKKKKKSPIIYFSATYSRLV